MINDLFFIVYSHLYYSQHLHRLARATKQSDETLHTLMKFYTDKTTVNKSDYFKQ